MPQLIVNRVYFVSYGSNEVYPCVLREVIKEGDRLRVEVAIPCKTADKQGFRDASGNMPHDWNSCVSISTIRIVSRRVTMRI